MSMPTQVTNMSEQQQATKMTWRVSEWCRMVGISRTMFYALHGEVAPKAARINTVTLILEPPAAYLERMSQTQQAA
jgi:hypothetical protein